MKVIEYTNEYCWNSHPFSVVCVCVIVACVWCVCVCVCVKNASSTCSLLEESFLTFLYNDEVHSYDEVSHYCIHYKCKVCFAALLTQH